MSRELAAGNRSGYNLGVRQESPPFSLREKVLTVSEGTTDLTPHELAEARQYRRLDLAVTLVDRVVDIAYLTVAAFWLALPIADWLWSVPGVGAFRSVRLVAMLVILMGLHAVISFPLSVYSGYFLEHRFKLSTLTFRGWLWRYAKHLLIGGVFSVIVFLGLYLVIWHTGRYWWLAGAGAFFVLSIVLGQLVPVLILPLFYKIDRLDAPELSERFTRLTEGTGLSIEGVYRMGLSAETVKANAMLAGLGRTRRVLLGDTLLDKFTPDEIAVIFAHEVGHHVFRHIHKMIFGGLVLSMAGFWIVDRLLVWWAGSGGRLDYTNLPISTLPMIMLILTVFGLVLEPLQNAVSRYFERQCDRYALRRTGMKEAFCSAFRKLARLNKSDPDPPRLEVLWLYSHPPISQRLALAEE